ncbi:DUF4401 domain-containing protein [Pyxidicoccus parkwayensis]|uniref:DUF4401 domain-containing protein n=1 Tax=Pyxidicoccus parkwayensis TaxID=2813578 RepID=A0ABX7NYT3_9BACT|nr:DUF4401 domain-containing protein [Pyxidicoccus parkwaysis]QSQ23960.1 DUF4401 domain-containing protein [Pyxidicoccus parkwaysis]
MARPSIQDVLKGLQAEGHVPADSEARARTALEVHQRNDVTTPWFVKALAGFGAWVAASFLLSFFGCVGLWKEEVMLALLGLIIGGGATLLRRATRGAFMEQLALALCLAGVAMVETGAAMVTESEVTPAVLQLVLGAALLVLFPDAILRFLMALGMAAAAEFLLWKALGELGMQLGLLGCAVLVHWLLLEQARLRRGRWGELVGPCAFALACGLMGALLTLNFAGAMLGELRMHGVPVPDALLTLGLTALTLYTASRVMKELGLEASGVAGVAVFVALAVLALMTLHTPAIITAVGMMVLGFHRRSTVLLGLAAAFLLAAGGWYYYDLGLTLLAKALALTGSGLVFLGLRAFLLRRFPDAPAEVR